MTGERVDVLEQHVRVLAWLHAELSFKHEGLVVELQTMIRQLMGGRAAADPVRAEAVRQRAVRIARIRAAANPVPAGQLRRLTR